MPTISGFDPKAEREPDSLSAGSGSAAGLGDVLLVHGFMGSAAGWSPALLEGLTAAGLAPLLVDLPGHGRFAGEVDPARFTLSAALERIGDAAGERCDVVGYSMGGRLALHFALRHPERVRRLVLESSSPGLADPAERRERRDADAALARKLEEDGVEAFVAHWESLALWESQAVLEVGPLESQRARRLANDPRSLAAALRRLGTGALPSLWDQLSEIEMPVLLVAGALDAKFVAIAQGMLGLLGNGQSVIVPGVGHAVHLERPNAWLEAVGSFLKGG